MQHNQNENKLNNDNVNFAHIFIASFNLMKKKKQIIILLLSFIKKKLKPNKYWYFLFKFNKCVGAILQTIIRCPGSL